MLLQEVEGASQSRNSGVVAVGEQLLTTLRRLRSKVPSVMGTIPVVVELLILLVWVLIVARPILDLNPRSVLYGREFLSAVQSHHIWINALQCGPCVMWNGGVQGGAPAFVDIYGSMLHPLVIMFTLGWGVINGAKLAFVGALFMAGLAQLWLGALFGLGRVARLWTACMAVAAGHLVGRVEIGTFSIVLSTAACSLVLPPLIALARTGDRRHVAILGLILGQALLAGQGYMQVALALCIPLILVLIPWQRAIFQQRLRALLMAAGIALLLAAPFLVPLLHFFPQFTKDSDSGFTSGQPFQYVLLNLVIDDPNFYFSPELQKLPFPYLYVNYVGWTAIALALLGLAIHSRKHGRETLFLALSALFPLWIASGQLFRLVTAIAPDWIASQITNLRYFPVMASLAIPPILALAGLGLEYLIQWLKRPVNLQVSLGEPTYKLGFDSRWLALPPLLIALQATWVFGQHWLRLIPLSEDVPVVLDALTTPGMEWVNTPIGEHFFVAPAVERGLKLALGIRPWYWRDRPRPPALLEATRGDPPPGMTLVGSVGGVSIYRGPPEHSYARLVYADGSFSPCSAIGRGGDIEVRCGSLQPGRLVIHEYTWSGWQARVDGKPARLEGETWLELDLPAGAEQVTVRYRPWDVPLGLALCLIGFVLAGYLLLQRKAETSSAPV